jgi:chemotaxis signal transduction protein
MKGVERAFDWDEIKRRLPLALQVEESPEELARLFRQRADALAKVASDEGLDAGALHLELGAGDVRLAVAMSDVRTIVQVGKVTAIPCAKDVVAHVVHAEGRIATLVDLALVFGQRSLALLPGRNFAVLLAVAGSPLGLWVNRVYGFRPIDGRALTTGARSGPGSDVLNGITADMTLVLSVEQLVASLRAEAQ